MSDSSGTGVPPGQPALAEAAPAPQEGTHRSERANGEAAARRLWDLWCQGQRPDLDEFLAQAGALSPAELVAVVQIDQRARWERGEHCTSEVYLKAHPSLCDDLDAALDLVYGEFLLREELGDAPRLSDFQQRFPEFADALAMQVEMHQALEAGATSMLGRGAASGTTVPPRLQAGS